MAKKDPRANSLVVLRGNSIQLEGRYDVLKDRPQMVSDGSGSFVVLDNQESIFLNLVAPPNGESQFTGTNLAPSPLTLGPHGATAPWGSPFQAWQSDAPVLFEEAAGKDEPRRPSGAPWRVSNNGKFAGNALPYKRPIYVQKLLELKRSAQQAVGLTLFSGSGTVAPNDAWTTYNSNYLLPFQSDVAAAFQSGNLNIQGPIQPVWWSVANWKLDSTGSADFSRMGRSLTFGTVGPSALTSSIVPSPYVYASGTGVPFIGTQAVRFATGGAIRDLSAVQTLNKHFRSDGTMTRQDVVSGSMSASLGRYIEDSGRLIQSPQYRIVPISNLNLAFASITTNTIINSTETAQFFDKSSFQNFLLNSGTFNGKPSSYRYSFRFNSIIAGAQFDYAMRRMASTEERFGYLNQLNRNKYVTVEDESVNTISEGMQKDLMPFPAIAAHNYYTPVHMFTMGGGEYKNRRQVGFNAVSYHEASNKTGFSEVGRQFSSHIDISPTFQETSWQSPGFFSFGWTKFPEPGSTFYSGSKKSQNGFITSSKDTPLPILTPEDYDENYVTSSMKLNYGLYHGGLGSSSFVKPPTEEVELANAYFWPDSYADARLVMRDKPEDVDVSPTQKVVRTGHPRKFISASLDTVLQVLNPLPSGSSARVARTMSQESGIIFNNLQRFYFVDTEYGREFPLRIGRITGPDDDNEDFGRSPLVSIDLTSGTFRDFSANTSVGGHWYSRPQADSFPFLASNLDTSWGQVDSGDPWPWNVHGSSVPFQTFTRRNHLYSLNNSTRSLDELGFIEFATQTAGAGDIAFLTLSNVPQNTSLGVAKNSRLTSHPVLAGAGLTSPFGSHTLRTNVGRSYAQGFRGGSRSFEGAPTHEYFSLDFPARGFEYFLTSAYYPNNIAREAVQSPVMMSTAGFDIPFSGSQDVAIDVWVQFMSSSTDEVTQR